MGKTLYMMIGPPCAGKSTYVLNNIPGDNKVVLSTDTYIEQQAVLLGKTYRDVFKKTYDASEKYMYNMLDAAIQMGVPTIVWDQTNCSRKSRMAKLSKVPSTYKKVGIVVGYTMSLDQALDKQRNSDRLHKHVPAEGIKHMMNQLENEPPKLSEGFDEIVYA